MSNLKIGIIGCGKQGKKHAKSLLLIGDIDVVCADLDEAAAKTLSDDLGVTNTLPDQVLSDDSLSAVVICTPTNSHVELIERALKSGKHVFCEKPLCLTVEEAEHIKQLEEETGFFVTVGFVYRYVPAFEWLYELADTSKQRGAPLGRPLHAVFRIGGRGEHQIWKHMQSQGGGVLNEMLVHMLDLAMWIVGPLEDVKIKDAKVLLGERTIQGQNVTVDAPDYITISAKTSSGAPVVFIGDMVTPAFTQYVDCQFANGSFMGSIQPSYPSQVFLKEAVGGVKAGSTKLEVTEINFFKKQMERFVADVLENKNPNRNSVEDSIAVMAIIDDLRKQI